MTKIGHLLSGGEYGSVMSNSPDGKYVFFSNQIYDVASGTWQAVPQSCVGNRSAWLSDGDVLVLRTVHDDGGDGPLCYYDMLTSATKTIGIAQWFNIIGDHILYEPSWWDTAAVSVSQIRMYDYRTGVDSLLIANALSLSPDGSHAPSDRDWLINQPVQAKPQCMDAGCVGGVAFGSPMLFNFETRSSSPLTLWSPSFGNVLF